MPLSPGFRDTAPPWREGMLLCPCNVSHPGCPDEEVSSVPLHREEAGAARTCTCGHLGQWPWLLTSPSQVTLLVAEVLGAPWAESSPDCPVHLLCGLPRFRGNRCFLRPVETYLMTGDSGQRNGLWTVTLHLPSSRTTSKPVFCPACGWGQRPHFLPAVAAPFRETVSENACARG